jgi:hypothetical protein
MQCSRGQGKEVCVSSWYKLFKKTLANVDRFVK